MNALQRLNRRIVGFFTGLFWTGFLVVTAYMEYAVITDPKFRTGKHPDLSYVVCVAILLPIVIWFGLMRLARRRGEARQARKAAEKQRRRLSRDGAALQETAEMPGVPGRAPGVPGAPARAPGTFQPGFPAYRQGPYRPGRDQGQEW